MLVRALVRAERARDERARRPAELDLPGDLWAHTIATRDGARLHVVERGSGPPIVLVHGLALSSRVWPYQLRSLAGNHRVVAVDVRGHGASVPGSLGLTIDSMAEDLRTVLEVLDLDDAVVVGHSMGGMLTLRAVIRHPELLAERMAGIVLLGGTAGARPAIPGWPRIAGWVGALGRRGLTGLRASGLAALPAGDAGYMAARIAFGSHPCPEHVEHTLEMTRAMDASDLADIVPEILAFDEWGSVHSVDCPVLVVAGSKDRLTPPAYASRLGDLIPSSELQILEGAGHMAMLERHHEIDEAIEKFASSVQGTVGGRGDS